MPAPCLKEVKERNRETSPFRHAKPAGVRRAASDLKPGNLGSWAAPSFPKISAVGKRNLAAGGLAPVPTPPAGFC